MASVGEINTLHRILERRLHNLIGMQLSIRSPCSDWEQAVKRSTTTFPISFDMVCHHHTESGQRKRGGRCPVFPLGQDPLSFEDQAWAGWHEEWYRNGRNVLDLIGVGWTFFWGIGGRLDREQQILRAEWDQIHQRGGSAAQPHWHLDTSVMAGYSRAVSRQVPTGEPTVLEELTSDTESALEEIEDSISTGQLDLSGMHLGMGGWQNHEDHPRRWQRQVSEDWRELVLWAERTLESAREQFGELKITEIAV